MTQSGVPDIGEVAPLSGEGRFSTGETAASFSVRITCMTDGLRIAFPETLGHEARLWRYTDLTSDAPLRIKSLDALLSSKAEPKAHLFITDASLLAAIGTRAPHLSPRAMRSTHARPWIMATLAVVLTVAAFLYSGLSPASILAKLLPERARIALGEQAVSAMVGPRPQCKDERGIAALNVLAARLASDGSFPHFDIVVVDWELMNAFAVPGDKIVLTRGLLDTAGDADEVAGVLAHEMGHGLKRHPEAAFVRAIGLAAAAELIMGGTGSTLANIGIVLAQLSYSRVNEREADETALTLLREAKISAKGFGRFFDRVLKEEENGATGAATDQTSNAIARAANLFRSHPPTEERRLMVAAAGDYPATPALSPLHWKALKAICGPSM